MASGFYKINSFTATSNVSSISFLEIPNTYKDLMFFISARSTRNDSDYHGSLIDIQINNDTGSNYYYSGMRSPENSTGGNPTYDGASGQTSGRIGRATNSVANAVYLGATQIYIPSYAGTTLTKVMRGMGGSLSNDTKSQFMISAVTWNSTAAITDIKFFISGYDFVSGTTIDMYGIKNS